ncbi:MAG: hypothetical protein RBU30_22610 [Polyangia bacterium]|nr:hypothetical protein [Polyangia bacterium]
MRKALITVSLMGFSLSLIACGKKDEKKAEDKGAKAGSSGFSCENVAKKNEECSADLVSAFMANLGENIPQEMKDRIATRTKERFSGDRWIKGCERRWDSDRESHKEQKAAMEKCFAIADCKEYAKCFAEIGGMGRGRGRMGRFGRGGGRGGDDPMVGEGMDAMGEEAPMDAMGEAPMDAMGEAPMDAMGEAPMDAME